MAGKGFACWEGRGEGDIRFIMAAPALSDSQADHLLRRGQRSRAWAVRKAPNVLLQSVPVLSMSMIQKLLTVTTL